MIANDGLFTGSVRIVNDLIADTLSGDGAGITNLNATNIASGTLSADRLATSGVTAGSYGPTANVNGSNGATINVPQITVDSKGRVTSVVNRVYTAVNTNTTYSNMTGATTSAAGTAGLVPAPAAGAATRYLRSDGTWQVPPDNNTTYTTFVKSGASAASGLVPAPSTTAGTTKYLREDGTWQVPPNTNTTYTAGTGISLSGTTFSNSGVRSIATGSTNGTISVNTNGTSAEVAVAGLGTAAYTASTAYAAASHTHSYLPLAGGTLTGALTQDIKGQEKLGHYVYGSASGTDGSSGYVGLIQITSSASYVNGGLTFTIAQRGKLPWNIYFQFSSSSTATAVTIASLERDAWGSDVYASLSSGVVKIYVQKSEAYDALTVTDMQRGQNSQPTVAFINELVSTKPTSGITTATIHSYYTSSGATAGSYGPSGNVSPSHSGTFSVPYFTIDAYGRVTAASTKTITLPADNNTTYSAGAGISLSGTTFSNSGVRSISTGSTNGTISVNTNGTSAEVAVKGLGTAAYTASTAYAAASHNHSASNITSGTLSVARGGTGQTTIAAAAQAMIDAMTTTITKSLTPTTDWTDTGIVMADISDTSGTFIVQVHNDTSASNGGMYSMRSSGIMSVYIGNTNSTDADEIEMHQNGQASSGNHVYLRVIRVAGSTSSGKLQICQKVAATAASTYTFKFRKMI